MSDLEDSVDRIAAETGFSGVVRVDWGDELQLAKAYGLAHRCFEIANTIDTRFAIASGTKGLTALTVMSLIEEGKLTLTTTARSVLGQDLPLIDDAVTVEQLLAHRSGIGDFLDEEIERDPIDYVLPISAHQLGSTEDYLRVLGGFETKFPPDERFSYSNGGFVVLALDRRARLWDTVPRTGAATRVRTRRHGGHGVPALGRAPGTDGARLPRRGRIEDERLPPAGPRERGRRHLHHRGGRQRPGTALFAGRIVSTDLVAEMVQPRSEVPSPTQPARYGLGIWLHPSRDLVELHGSDAGVSFQTVHDPSERFTYTVRSNTTEGAWPIVLHLDELFAW